MKKRIALALAALMVLCLAGQGLAESAQPTGELVIYSSMYPYVLEMLDGALREAFPGLTPGNDGSFFVYGGSSALINTIYQDMKTGTLGCAGCYQAFRQELTPLITRMQGRTQHAGRRPPVSEEEQARQTLMEDLRARMEAAVAEENFEEAARLRDELRAMTPAREGNQ